MEFPQVYRSLLHKIVSENLNLRELSLVGTLTTHREPLIEDIGQFIQLFDLLQ